MATDKEKQRKVASISKDYGDGDLELSDSDDNADERNTTVEIKQDVSYISKTDSVVAETGYTLPDAGQLFSTVKKPSFLDSKYCNTDVDWDKLAKSKMPLDSEEISNTHTVPPPTSYEAQSAALKPTLGDPHEADVTERKRHIKDIDANLAESGPGSKLSKVTEDDVT